MNWPSRAGSRTASQNGSRTAQVSGPRTESTNRLDDEIAAVRQQLTARRRAVRGLTAAMAVVVLFAMFTAASEVRRFALAAGFGEFAAASLDPVVGFALLVLVAVNAWIADAGRRPPWWSQAGVHFAGAVTLLMNCWPSFADRSAEGVLLHLVMPGLLIIFATAAPQIRRILSEIIGDLLAAEARLAGQMDAAAREVEEVAAERAAAAEQAAREVDAAERADAERAANSRRWAEQDASERRIAEARALAEIEADRVRAETDAELARSAAQAELARAQANRPRQTRPRSTPSTAKARKTTSTTSTAPPPRDEAIRIVAQAIRDHRGPDPYVLNWREWSRDHGGGKTFWFSVRDAAVQPAHLAASA